MKILKLISLVLVIVGDLNWLLVGLFNFNLVTALLGDGTLSTIVYVLVGLAALYSITIFADLTDRAA